MIVMIGLGILLWAAVVLGTLAYCLVPREPREIRLDPEKARRL